VGSIFLAQWSGKWI